MVELVEGVLPGFVIQDVDGEDALVFYNHDWAIDWNTRPTLTPAVVDRSGNVIERAVMMRGFFANVIVLNPDIDITALRGKDRKPTRPQRGFAR